MNQPTRSHEQSHRSGHLSGTTVQEEKHREQPQNTDKQTSNPAKKFYLWLKSHHLQIVGLPTHDKLNLLFTLVIAAATVCYVIVTKHQLDEMRASGAESDRQIKQLIEQARGQATNTGELAKAARKQADAAKLQSEALEESAIQSVFNSNLQVQIARLEHGAASLTLTPWMGFFREKDRLFAVVAVQNERGTTGATSIQVAAQMRFRDTPPSDYSVNPFLGTTPAELPAFTDRYPPFTGATGPNDHRKFRDYALAKRVYLPNRIQPRQYSIYKDRTIYVWGRIRFKDFTGDWAPIVPFCREIKAENIFTAVEGNSGGTTSETNCQ